MEELFIDKVKDLGVDNNYVRWWKVKCNLCGTVYTARAGNVKHRKRTVCITCSPKLVYKKSYGNTKDPLYTTWSLIKRRVDNTTVKKQSNDFHYKGILLCEEWKTFCNFRKWSLANGYKKELTIDRINNEGNYEPSNCRWVDSSTQIANRRRKNSTGYAGIVLSGRPTKPYLARVTFKGKKYLQKRFKTLQEAVEARNATIEDNNLPNQKEIYKGKV